MKLCTLSVLSTLSAFSVLVGCGASPHGRSVSGDGSDGDIAAETSSEESSFGDFGDPGTACDDATYVRQGEFDLPVCPKAVVPEAPPVDAPPGVEAPPAVEPPAANAPPTITSEPPPAYAPPADEPTPGVCDNPNGCDAIDLPPTCELPPEEPGVCKEGKYAVCHVPGHDIKGWNKRFTLCLPLPAVDADPADADHVGHGDKAAVCVFPQAQ